MNDGSNNIDGKNEDKRAVKTVSLIIFATGFSKILGLIREILLAALYGKGMENSAFTIALDFPLNFFEILFGAAVLGVFIPVYNSFENKGANQNKEAEEFSNIFINFVILATGLLAFIGIIFSRQIVNIAAAGYDEQTKILTADLLRIMLPMIIFTGSVYTITGILQSKGEFLAPALVSSFSNLGVIIYFLFLNKNFGVYGLACAYLISWMIQLVTLVVPLVRKKYKYRFKLDFKNAAFAKSLKIALPVLAGSWLLPMSKQIANIFSSLCPDYDSAVAAFGKSWQMFLIITGILTYGVCNYIFPKLAQNSQGGEEKQREFAGILKSGLSVLMFVIIPVSCLAYVLRGEAVAILFMRNKFTPDVARLSSQMFIMLAPSMIMFSVIEVLNRVFYSKNLVKFPMIASVSGIVANFVLCWIFINAFNFPPVYIALANFICQTVTAGILIFALNIKIKEIFDKKFTVNIGKIALSSVISLIIIKIIYFFIDNNAFESGNFVKNIEVSAVILIAGATAYAAANIILKTDEIKFVMKMLKKK